MKKPQDIYIFVRKYAKAVFHVVNRTLANAASCANLLLLFFFSSPCGVFLGAKASSLEWETRSLG